jgi:hypothetical protein
MQLLVVFVEQNISPRQLRKLRAAEVDSGMRKWNIKARNGAHGAYPRPVRWSMTAEDVVASGAEKYTERVSAWARSILADLRASGNLD